MTIFPSPLSLSFSFPFRRTDDLLSLCTIVLLHIFFCYSQLSVAAYVGKSAFLVHNPSVFFSIPRGNLGVGGDSPLDDNKLVRSFEAIFLHHNYYIL